MKYEKYAIQMQNINILHLHKYLHQEGCCFAYLDKELTIAELKKILCYILCNCSLHTEIFRGNCG